MGPLESKKGDEIIETVVVGIPAQLQSSYSLPLFKMKREMIGGGGDPTPATIALGKGDGGTRSLSPWARLIEGRRPRQVLVSLGRASEAVALVRLPRLGFRVDLPLVKTHHCR
ncbi:hypothetical protein CRG98_009618 [Punica granatum]|uniref:Uncharacterized protein n=1 Tax=Punica granatum TaxID=22663 RepID=A0A2I0KNF1_PUNGR|nr:hypothetical protein CRG98_009618 [Punica granatum]